MTRARRALPALLAVLTAALLSLAMFAGPALATEGEAESDGDEATATGFGAGQWDGMILAAGAGVIVGVLVFSMSRPGEIHKVADHH